MLFFPGNDCAAAADIADADGDRGTTFTATASDSFEPQDDEDGDSTAAGGGAAATEAGGGE